MGYKLAGYTVLGNCEIDPEMEKVYQANHHPKYTFPMDIREFNKLGTYPDELKNRLPALLRVFGCGRQGERLGQGKAVPRGTENAEVG